MPLKALIGFDHLTTLQQELELFWRKNFDWSCILFFINRYVALIYYIAMLPLRLFPSVSKVSVIPFRTTFVLKYF